MSEHTFIRGGTIRSWVYSAGRDRIHLTWQSIHLRFHLLKFLFFFFFFFFFVLSLALVNLFLSFHHRHHLFLHLLPLFLLDFDLHPLKIPIFSVFFHVHHTNQKLRIHHRTTFIIEWLWKLWPVSTYQTKLKIDL